MYTVYKHIFPNGKIYIGITSQKPEYRWNHGSGYNLQIVMKRAIEKYDWQNVQHEILFTGLTKEEAKIKEIELIALYHSNDPKYGYNTSLGGDIASDDTINKLKLAHTGVKQSCETVQKRSEALKKAHAEGKFDGVDRSFHKSAEYRNKRSIIMREKWQDPDQAQKMRNAHNKAVKSEEYRRNQSVRAKIVNNRPEVKAKFSGANNGKSKTVICVDTGERYVCAAEAGKLTGTSINGICMCCRGERKTAGGYHWQYAV